MWPVPMQLDEYQQTAVNSDAPLLQIVGYPGTGKTVVLARRIARLIEDGTPSGTIVALSFTRSSCFSLRRSIAKHLPPHLAPEAANVRVHTYHTFCQGLIEQSPSEVGISSEWCLTDFLDLHNVLYYPTLDTQRRNSANYPQNLTPVQRQKALDVLKDFKAYDFDQALRYGHMIIEKRALNIGHLFIDEFQDCTSMQWGLVRAILQAHPNTCLTVAGDPNQEIFNFQPDHLESAFDTMKRDYAETNVQFLRYNYRSTQQIIDTFQEIVSANAQVPADRRLIATLPHGNEPEMIVYSSPDAEAEGVAGLIRELCDPETGRYCLDDISVLLRTNSEVQRYAAVLRQHGMALQLDSGVRAFGVRPKPGLALTLMKWAHSSRDFYLSQLLFNRYHRFISTEHFEILMNSCSEQSVMPLAQRLIEIDAKKYTHPLLTTHLPAIRDALNACETPREVGNVVLSAVDGWKEMAGSRTKKKDTLNESAWQQLVEELDLCAKNVSMDDLPLPERAQKGAALALTLKYIFSGEKPFVAKEGGVSLSTVHSAKSKEWPVVFLPEGFSRNSWWLTTNENDNRRLQYVAASRARKELYFSSAGPIQPHSRNSFVKTRTPTGSPAGLSLDSAIARDPMVFKPIHALRKLVRTVRFH